MEVLIVFSRKHVPSVSSLGTALHALEERERQLGQMVFDKIIVINQDNMPYPKDIMALFKRTELVEPDEFTTEPYANYTVCAEGANSDVAFDIAHALRHATNGWGKFDDMDELLAKRYALVR